MHTIKDVGLILFPKFCKSKFGEKESNVLSALFKSYFDSNTVTDNLRGMNVTQAFEKNDKNYALDYQPISLVCTIRAPRTHCGVPHDALPGRVIQDTPTLQEVKSLSQFLLAAPY